MPRRFSWGLVAALALGGGPAAWVAAPAATTFATPLNNAQSLLAADHAAGSGTLTVRAGDGALFGAPSPSAPVRVTVASRTTLAGGQIAPGTARTIFLCTARTGDVLSGLTATEATSDQAFQVNDPIAALVTAGTISDVHAAVVANTAAVATKATDSAVVHLAGTETVTGTKTHAAPTVVDFSAPGNFTNGVLHKVLVNDGANPSFNFALGGFAQTQFPADLRKDQVMYMGWNVGVGGSPLDGTQPSCGLGMESYWRQLSPTLGQFEWHNPQFQTTTGTTLRPFSTAILYDGSQVSTSMLWDALSVSDHTGTQQLLWQWPTMRILGSNLWQHDTNNVKWLKQVQSFGDPSVSIAFVNSSNQVELAQAGTVTKISDALQVTGTIGGAGGGTLVTTAGLSTTGVLEALGNVKVTGTIGGAGGGTLQTTAGMQVNGTLFIGAAGSEFLFSPAAGSIVSDSNWTVGGQFVVNQNLIANPAGPAFRIRPSAGQTGNLTNWEDGVGATVAAVRPDGSFRPGHIAEASAAADSMYYCTTHSKLEYKDPGGVVNPLY